MLQISTDLLKYFKHFCSSPSLIMLFVYMKCRFSLSYRELEEMMIIRGANIDHSTLQRWVKRFTRLIDTRVRCRKKPVNGSWRMDETYIKLNGKWVYLYRAVDKSGSNKAALDACNEGMEADNIIEIRQIKYLNNIVEQDHRFIKKRTRPTLGFKNFHSAAATITGIENIRIIQKGQIQGCDSKTSTFQNFCSLMA